MNNKYFKFIGIIFLVALAIVFISLRLKGKFASNLDYNRIVKFNDKCGLKDKNEKFIVKPIYDRMEKIQNGLIVVIKDNKLGLLDNRGDVVLSPTYDTNFLEYHFRFSDGLAAVIKKTKDGYNNCVYIDKTGKEVLDPIKYGASTVQDESYGACSQFSEGLAPVTYTFDGKEGHFAGGGYGYINKQGKVVIKVDNVDDQMCGDALCILGFQNGIASVGINGQWKYIDKTGKFIKKPKYDYIGEYSEGLAPICGNSENYKENKCGFVDKNGKIVIHLHFDGAMAFSEELAPVHVGYKWGYINKVGEMIIQPKFEVAKSFTEGLAPAGFGYDNYGFIDKTGKFVIKPQYWEANNFSNGEAFVKKAGNDKCYYINKKGGKLYETCCGLE